MSIIYKTKKKGENDLKKRGLIIAEKPSLMRDIQTAYGVVKGDLDFILDFTSLRGYFMQLKSPEEYKQEWGKPWNLDVLPMVPDNFKFNIIKGCEADYKKIKSMMDSGSYDFIVNACDAGREGQSIFGTLYQYSGCKLPVKRLWASDTTVETIGHALKNLLDGNEPHLANMEKSSFYRMYFDWLLGMNLSRAVTLKTSKGIPVGRVMTPTLNIVVQRDLEIANFVSKDFYQVEGDFGTYKGMWFDPSTDETSFSDKAKAELFLKKLAKTGFIEKIDVVRQKEKAPALHSLGELQKDANAAYGFSAQETLNLAQSLYETHKILSYPRTESRALSTNMAKEIKKHLNAIKDIDEVKDIVGNILADDKIIDKTMKSTKYVDNAKITDHHAIIPTHMKPKLDQLSDKELKLYMLVVKKFVAIFMDPYVTDKTTIITDVSGEKFKSTGSVLVDIGYRALYKSTKADVLLPALKEKDSVTVKAFNILEKKTTPPSYYTEGELIDAMQKAGKFIDDESYKNVLKEVSGIGTSATRANIIEKLFKTEMLTKKGKSIRATDFGIKIIEILSGRDIISPILTAQWEKKLQDIENGDLPPEAFYKEMIQYVKEQTDDFVKNIKGTISSLDSKEEIGACPSCGGKVVMTDKYYLCKNYGKEEGKCKFILGKEVCGAKLTKAEVVKLLNGKPTKKLKMKKRDGSTFESSLYYDKTKNNLSFGTGESKSAAAKTDEVLGKCPCCGGDVLDKGSYAKCQDTACAISISYKIRDAELSKKDIKDLLAGKTIGPKTFTWSSGKKGEGSLKYDSVNKKIIFVF